jgi:hypothetical protein
MIPHDKQLSKIVFQIYVELEARRIQDEDEDDAWSVAVGPFYKNFRLQ